VVHYQDHPRGAPEKFSTDEKSSPTKQNTHNPMQHKTQRPLKATEKSRKQDEKCAKMRGQANKLEARMKTYSESKNERPASYLRQQKQLIQQRQYLESYCN